MKKVFITFAAIALIASVSSCRETETKTEEAVEATMEEVKETMEDVQETMEETVDSLATDVEETIEGTEGEGN